MDYVSPVGLKLKHVRVGGFKALRRFSMTMSQDFTLLIGMNGAGKSSVLQSLGFLRYLVEGRGKSFFEERGWDQQDIRFRSTPRAKSTVISISLIFQLGLTAIQWDIDWGLNGGSLFSELVKTQESGEAEWRTILEFNSKEGGSVGPDINLPAISLTGSVVAAVHGLVDQIADGRVLRLLSNWASGIRSLELLSPQAMKGGTRLSPHDMGVKGDRLAGFLASLTSDQKARVTGRVGQIYPIGEYTTTRKRAGWIDLQVAESYRGMGNIPAMHMSDGFMRLLTLCAIPELGDDVTLVLLDELEDGIEPHVLPRIVDIVKRESRAQIVATSHSPLLVNHLNVDDIKLITRNEDGLTFAANVSEMPAFKVGADFFGAGEMWTSSEPAVLQTQAASQQDRDPNRSPGGDNLL